MKKIILAAAVLASAVLLNSFVPKGDSPTGYKVGDKASDFSLKNIDGKNVALADFISAKGVILIFTCNHCPFSVAYENRIVALDKQYASQGYPVVAINPNDAVAYPDDSYSNMITRAKQKGFTFPYLVDESQAIARTYGAAKTPHVFVLQKSGVDFVVKYIGAIDDNTNEPSAVKQKYVEDAVNALLKGEEVKTTFTKAIGCGVKWKKA
ncbi:MAG: thioredoxin family protein [Cytophagales bacterium]|nr:thioredoxin family protein [Cytophagales bacterium]